MPELPEVETTARGIRPHILQQKINNVVVRQSKLRHRVTPNMAKLLQGQRVTAVNRRAKYVLIYLQTGCVIVHLGMSGSLRALRNSPKPEKHDHIDISFSNGRTLRYTDPRRFGCVLYTKADPLKHKLLHALGPEPLSDEFQPRQLYQQSRGRKGPIKNFIMDGKIVVGVGNIYASESLFRAGILPHRQAGRVSQARFAALHGHIRDVLKAAIKQGGTTLRDYTDSEGFPGYFAQQLDVYGREGEPCGMCKQPIKMKVIGQRSSFYCTNCQK